MLFLPGLPVAQGSFQKPANARIDYVFVAEKRDVFVYLTRALQKTFGVFQLRASDDAQLDSAATKDDCANEIGIARTETESYQFRRWINHFFRIRNDAQDERSRCPGQRLNQLWVIL